MHPNKRNFEEGLVIIVDSWAAMNMAIQMETAGPKTADLKEDFIDSLLEYFEKEATSILPNDLEDLLMDVMAGEFMINLEDGSEISVAKSILLLFGECIKGRTEYLDVLRGRRNRGTNELNIVNGGDDSCSEEGSSDCGEEMFE